MKERTGRSGGCRGRWEEADHMGPCRSERFFGFSSSDMGGTAEFEQRREVP